MSDEEKNKFESRLKREQLKEKIDILEKEIERKNADLDQAKKRLEELNKKPTDKK